METAAKPPRKPVVRYLWVLITATVIGQLCGCSKEIGTRVAVYGDVRLDGKPLQAGAIIFHCSAEDQEIQAVGYIEDGKYSIAEEDGPLVGRARVEFQSKPVDPDTMEELLETRGNAAARAKKMVAVVVPDHYSVNQTTLSADITDGSDNKHDFDLKSRL